MRLLASLAVMVCLLPIAAHAQGGPWEGTWQTQFGDVVMRQYSNRVWGDYVAQQGVIEARVQPDGNLRGTFLRSDGDWGFFEFRLEPADRGWIGVYAMQGLPQLDGKDSSWHASAKLGGAALLRYATADRDFWPPSITAMNDPSHVAFLDGPGYETGSLPIPVPPPVRIVVPLSYEGALVIRDGDNGERVGTITVESDDEFGPVGAGEVFAAPGARDMTPFSVSIRHLTRAALELELSFPVASGLPHAYLLVDRAPLEPEGLLGGTLIRQDAGRQDWTLVTLAPEGMQDDDALFDAPGFGVYATAFGLRNNSGASVGLRGSPRSDSAISAALSPEVRDLWVSECTPEVDGLTWETATYPARLAMLDRVWCHVMRENLPLVQGWVPGFFLAPQPN